jgi:alpha-galactosidase
VEEIASVSVHPQRARVYPEGWQSWSPAGLFPVGAPPAPAGGESAVIDCQYRQAAPEGVFQGSGLLAVDPGNGEVPVVFGAADASSRVPVIQAVLRGEHLVVSADAPVVQRADGGPGGMLGVLGRWADRFGPRAGLLRAAPTVWCTWYQYYERVTERDVLGNLELMARLRLPIDVVQLDDGYQTCPGDWLSVRPGFGDLLGLVARIRDAGRRAGIWIAPWLVGGSSALFREHPDWVVREPGSGEPVYAGSVVRDGCFALDLTHPGAAGYLVEVLRTMRSWGIDYFKADFCYAGAYEGVRAGAESGGVAAYRQGLQLIRSAIGPEATLVGCGAPTLASVGLVDAMRVGPDIAARYEPADGSLSSPSQRNATRNVLARAWQHGRFWVNDPDCMMLRPSVERRADWASVLTRCDGLRASGDGLRYLDSWGLETTRALLRPAPVAVSIPA